MPFDKLGLKLQKFHPHWHLFLVIRKLKSTSKMIEELKTYEFKLKIKEKVVNYLRCHIMESERQKKIVMPHLINWLIQKFEKKYLENEFTSPIDSKIQNSATNKRRGSS
jgi:hypothetical protein